MRRVRYSVAASLDGYIAGPHGEFDWIPMDPSIDFDALFGNVDTVLLGRRSYELVASQGSTPWHRNTRVYVFSRTLSEDGHPGVTVVRNNAAEVVAALRAEHGTGDIWLFGGGELFGSLLAAHQVDDVEVAIVPILLGGGIPLLPTGTASAKLLLTHSHVYPSGIVALNYTVNRDV